MNSSDIVTTTRATRCILPQYQDLRVADRVSDYGLGRNDFFEVVGIKRGQEAYTLFSWSEKHGLRFSWEPMVRRESEHVVVYFQFRGFVGKTGLVRDSNVWVWWGSGLG